MNLISNILYWISTGLLVPVIVLLIFFFIRALIMIGGFYGQYMQQRRVAEALSDFVKKDIPTHADIDSIPQSITTIYLRKIIETDGNEARTELLLSEFETAMDKNISISKMLTKMGPILGLMGTLIPMGPALVGLASGDIASMAYNMQVAFATTVVGLVICAIGFLTQQVKERWAVSNLAVLEYVADVMKLQNGKQS